MVIDPRDLEIAALQEQLSRLSQASRRINESLDFDTVIQGILDSAQSLTGARYGVITLPDGRCRSGTRAGWRGRSMWRRRTRAVRAIAYERF